MFGYPFAYRYFKTEQNRTQLANALKGITYLSDADFKKTQKSQSVFYGEISEIDFSLENISKKQTTTNFVRGHFLGAENDTFIRIRCGAWQHQRVYFGPGTDNPAGISEACQLLPGVRLPAQSA